MPIKKIKGTLSAGHGGQDRTNRGYSGEYIEADGNLEFVLFMKERFDMVSDLFDIKLSRDKDVTMSLTEKGKTAKGRDFYLSAHSDAYNKSSFGVTVFDSVDLDNTELGIRIGKKVAELTGSAFRGCKERESTKYKGEDYYTEIDVAQDIGCPNVLLLERLFHSNPIEEKKLLDKDLMKKVAYAVADEYIKWYFPEFDFNTIDEKESNPTATPSKRGTIINVQKTANVRIAPNHSTSIVTTIPINTDVLIRYEVMGTFVDNNEGKWMRIRFEKNGIWYDGYISSSKVNRYK